MDCRYAVSFNVDRRCALYEKDLFMKIILEQMMQLMKN